MTSDVDFQTAKCIACGSPDVVIWGGHVHIGIWHIFAGFCKIHQNDRWQDRPEWLLPLDRDEEPCNAQLGCFGRWHPRAGLRVGVASGIYKSGRVEVDFP